MPGLPVAMSVIIVADADFFGFTILTLASSLVFVKEIQKRNKKILGGSESRKGGGGINDYNAA